HLLPPRKEFRMTCYLTVLYLACQAAQILPGVPAPACDGEPVAVLARIHGSLLDEDASPPWLYEVEPERRPTECSEHPIELVPIETRYPTCVVGHVERVETTIGEGEDAVTLPARPRYLGVCCTLGCRLAGA